MELKKEKIIINLKKEDLKQPICPIEKEEAIKDAFKYFKII